MQSRSAICLPAALQNRPDRIDVIRLIVNSLSEVKMSGHRILSAGRDLRWTGERFGKCGISSDKNNEGRVTCPPISLQTLSENFSGDHDRDRRRPSYSCGPNRGHYATHGD
jgi:hypothetical protein